MQRVKKPKTSSVYSPGQEQRSWGGQTKTGNQNNSRKAGDEGEGSEKLWKALRRGVYQRNVSLPNFNGTLPRQQLLEEPRRCRVCSPRAPREQLQMVRLPKLQKVLAMSTL